MEKVHKKILSNGLTVMVQNVPNAESVSFCVGVKTGSRYENSKTLGFAHFLEHMLFEGTKKMETSRELSEYLENIGGVGGAFTEKEYITYYVKVLPISFQIGMSYILDILFNSALPQTAIEIEKGIVTEEIYRKSDNPEVEIWDLWLSWVFGEKSGIGQPTLGTVDQLSHINQSALKKYMKNYYQPSNMVISIVGNLSHAKLNDIYKTLTSIKNTTVKKGINTQKTLTQTSHVKLINQPGNQAQYILGFVTDVGHTHKDRPTLALINDILGGGISSRIFYKMVYESGMSYSSLNYFWPLHEAGLLMTSGGISPQNIDKGIQILTDCFYNLKENDIKKEEMERAKKRMIANLHFSNETTNDKASNYILQEITTGNVKNIDQLEKEIRDITIEDIQRVNNVFTYNNAYLLIRGNVQKTSETQLNRLLKQLIPKNP